MHPYKEKIEKSLNSGNIDIAEELLQNYLNEFAKDLDYYCYNSILNIYKQDYESAFLYAKEGVQKFPTSADMHYNLANIYECLDDIIAASKHYVISLFLYKYDKNDNKELYSYISDKINELENKMMNLVDIAEKTNNYKLIDELNSYCSRNQCIFGKNEKVTRNMQKQIIGTEYWITDTERRYIGIEGSAYHRFKREQDWNLVHSKGEFLKATKTKGVEIIGDAKEYLLPIAAIKENTVYCFKQNDEKENIILQRPNKQFSYFKVETGTKVYSNEESFYSEPIPLEHSKKRKKIVLNIFFDGLSQEILNGDDFQKIMPYTYKFFSKGIICTQAHSNAEWTFPAVASSISGLDVLQHMMFHSEIDGELPDNVTTLMEYFHEAGYYTAVRTGDWRCVPSYGYARGVDRYIYQIQNMGSKAEQIISDVISHLQTFSETDQFLWMSIGDLHDIADGFELPTAVQAKLAIENRIFEEKGITSVKQVYSNAKISMYKEMATYIDILLNNLYTYIDNNYNEDECLIGLFADHGQGYMVQEGHDFLSKERTKIAYMFRDGKHKGVTNEIMSLADYVPIMCKLAGIQMKNEQIIGTLPAVFGGNEKEYVITESLHPGDLYRAALNTKEFVIYFCNGSPTRNDGRFELKDYKIYGEYLDGTKLENEDILNHYKNVILERIYFHSV